MTYDKHPQLLVDISRLVHILCLHLSLFFFSCFSLQFFFQHEDNCMDIREYVIALSVVCRPAKTLETMKLAFKVCSVPSLTLI